MASIALSSVTKAYGTHKVIRGVDLDIADGEFVVFVGPSGCGKSTLLRIVAGLVPASGGQVLIDGEDVTDVPASKRGVAFVFQSYALYPHMSVERNIGFALETLRIGKDAIRSKVDTVARMLKVDHLLARRPRELSGGQRQRVAIGRALVREPEIFLFDEPLSNLDSDLRMEMRIEIARLHETLKTTMVYVTHDQAEAMTLADRIVVLNQGSIEQVGTPLELYQAPANRFVAGFIGSPRMNFGTVPMGAETGAFVLPAGLVADAPSSRDRQPVSIGVRPEALSIVAADAGRMSGILERVEDLGHEHFAYIRLSDESIWVVRVAGRPPTERRNQPVGLSFADADIFVFDAEGKRMEHRAAGPTPATDADEGRLVHER
ncbi:carbohydrate ABC transporter ATP-binding protein (CUT1 family) [Rhizobium sp. PP-F2F-G48]|uniref:ABC transporter ATP-binding protein n=1 Tax=Rhizobium sp. PP-F2F-G48 TaxID=2135651 RepID=UPI00104CEC50|nr:ABC transporter ATP-binding protein [Rhizobium sp. PP-F2F-G48]TCM52134.1 carbohydrate ABC transporter ATP-binding protein (CUT1 family) [Rhizobium sp. PP-F2F-G48]